MKDMTVGRLIKELQKFNPDARVMIESDGDGCLEKIKEVRKNYTCIGNNIQYHDDQIVIEGKFPA